MPSIHLQGFAPDAPTQPLQLPHVWRAQSLALAAGAVLPSGFAALDAQLPGGGWPAAGAVELLQEPGAQHDWRLLLPVLGSLVAQRSGPVVLVGVPQLQVPQAPGQMPGLMPFGPALAAQGLPPERLLWVQADAPAARLWACEQALRCADVLAVLAWLPRLTGCAPEALRRLHLGALDHGKPLFLLRPASARQAASAAPLRLLLGGVDALELRIFKRRGPPLMQPLLLAAWPERLAATLAARRRPAPRVARPVVHEEGVYALARRVAA